MQPLDGINILLLPGNLATRCAGRRLAELGSRVICLTSDLAELDNRITESDIVLVDHRTQALDETLARKLNPKIIIGYVYGLGCKSPWRDEPCDDLKAQGMSGLVHLSGNRDDPPTPFAIPIGEFLAGAHLVQGVLAALYRRSAVGIGAKVEVSLLESLLDLQFEVLTTHFADGGRLPARSKQFNAHAYLSAPYGIYPTSDGHLALGMADVAELGRKMGSEIVAQFKNPDHWFTQRDQIQDAIADHLKKKSTSDWLALLEPQDVWCAEVMRFEKLKTLPGYQVLDMDRDNRSPVRIRLDEQKSKKPLKNQSYAKPLEGLLIIDFSQFLSGPCASLRLADLGARVIKIEKPIVGDICRQLYVSDVRFDGESTTFHAINRNKESYVADLKSATGLDEIKKLIAHADVVMHNFRPGVMQRLGLGYQEIKSINSNIIYASISGYGDRGPWRDKPGQDLLLQAISGLAYRAGNTPVAMGLSVVDQMAGQYLAQGILAALNRRVHAGCGSQIEVSMLEAAIDLQVDVEMDRDSDAYPAINWIELQASDLYRSLRMMQVVKRRNGSTYQTTRCPIILDGERLLSEMGSPDLGGDTEVIKASVYEENP